MTGERPDAADELARLRKLEHGLRAERERIRAAAADEVLQLQAALRETAARAAQRERELEGLRAQLQRGSGGLRLRPRRRRSDPGTSGADQRVVATFERERQQLEERARAVAETELRQHKRQAELERLAQASGDPEQLHLSAELQAAEERVAQLEQQLRETTAALDRSERLGEALAAQEELARREAEVSQREVELSLVRRRIGEEERRLQERAWRTGAVQRRQRGPVVARSSGELSFSEGWRLLSRGRDGEPPAERSDWRGGNW